MKNFNSIALGKRIKKLRIEEGLSQQDLANELGVKQSVISKYERGAVSPNYETLIQLAQLFKTSTDYLLGLEKFK